MSTSAPGTNGKLSPMGPSLPFLFALATLLASGLPCHSRGPRRYLEPTPVQIARMRQRTRSAAVWVCLKLSPRKNLSFGTRRSSWFGVT
ncbi:hypothetical protein JB92DRAFT_3017886 [Gautieria morchelliformis]|nr:hypothetical protein JB92DRAFT_3017886 [Gautieria morchelliformis]